MAGIRDSFEQKLILSKNYFPILSRKFGKYHTPCITKENHSDFKISKIQDIDNIRKSLKIS